MTPLVDHDFDAPWYLRPLLWVAHRATGKDPLPAKLLTLWPRAAISTGLFEATAAGPGELEPRALAAARITASREAGCAFCLDMNAAAHGANGLSADELEALLVDDLTRLSPREATAARYARALTTTPVHLSEALRDELRGQFSPRELVILAHTIAQVNYWARFNRGLDVPAAGFFQGSCRLPGVEP
jgi:alkylhydroperoxidase family enzyme